MKTLSSLILALGLTLISATPSARAECSPAGQMTGNDVHYLNTIKKYVCSEKQRCYEPFVNTNNCRSGQFGLAMSFMRNLEACPDGLANELQQLVNRADSGKGYEWKASSVCGSIDKFING